MQYYPCAPFALFQKVASIFLGICLTLENEEYQLTEMLFSPKAIEMYRKHRLVSYYLLLRMLMDNILL